MKNDSRRDAACCVRCVKGLRPYLVACCLTLAGCARQNVVAPNNVAATEPSKVGQIIVGQFLDGQTPLSLRLKELSNNWKRIEINGESEGSSTKDNNDRFPVELLRDAVGARDGIYFTQWKTVGQNDDTFLVCYRTANFSDSDIRALFTRKNEYSKPNATQFMSTISQWLDDRPLDLVLLNMKNVKVINDTRAVNWAQSLEAARAWADKNLSSESSTRLSSRERLQLLAQGTLRFARDNNDTLPPLDDVANLQTTLSSYIFDKIWWSNPQTGQPFLANAVLANKKLAHITSPQDMILFYEENANADGGRHVSFLDGSARQLNAQDWQKYKKGSKIR